MTRTYSTTSLLRKTSLSKLIYTINEIRTGILASNETPRPRLRWFPYKADHSQCEANKFRLRIRFTNYNQKEEILPCLNKQFLIDKSSAFLASNEVDISPSENNEDVKVILEELIRSACERRIVCNDGGKSLLSETLGGVKKKIIVEFGSPNIAKPLHMGHLRSTVTGHYVARICKAAGHQVVTMCFLGDWGTQFGLLQAGLSHWLPEESMEQSVSTLELPDLLQYYVRAVQEQEVNKFFAHEAREFSAALERQDNSTHQVWASIREKTLRHLESIWKQLGIQYDVIQGESEFATRSIHTENALEILKESRLSEVKDGCTYATLPSQRRQNQNLKLPLVKADGSSLYLLRDIAAALSRQDTFGFDKMIYVVDKSQANHFINLFSLLAEIGFSADIVDNSLKSERNLQHVSFGKVEGMSTRSGNFVLFSDVIRDGSKLMEENRLKSSNVRNKNDSSISTKLALSALIVNFLRIRRNRDCHFDWASALRSQGDTGVRLQYTHSRLKSLEEKHEFQTFDGKFVVDFSIEYILNDPIALDLSLHLVNFEDAFSASYDELEPSILLTYLFTLCEKISKALKELKVISEPNSSIAQTRFLLFALSRRTLAIGLDIIGIEPLDQI